MSKVFLDKEISLRDLQKGIEFEIDHEESNSSSDESFDDENFNSFKQEISEIEGKIKPKMLSGTAFQFSELKQNMKPVTEDGQVLKEVIKCGAGIVIPEKSVVMMHYDAYIENQKEPFDSTRLRNKVFKFLTGDGNLIPGLELGIKTMKKDEISRFIISPEYAYGPMGCPPRIPGNANILYEVEIINFYESRDVIEFEEMSPEEQKRAPFEKIVAVYHCENQMGNELFRKKLYKPAVARYRRMVNLFENVSVDNAEDDDKRKNYLLKLYLNLSLCYINLQNPTKGIIYANLVLKWDRENPKALYRMGCALDMTGEYEKALCYLNKAKKHKPYEKSINKMLIKLEQKRKYHLDWERGFYKKMFGAENKGEPKPRESLETVEFRNVIEEEINSFLSSEDRELVFSSGYTENQIDTVKELASSYGLAFITKIQNDNKIIKIAKRTESST